MTPLINWILKLSIKLKQILAYSCFEEKALLECSLSVDIWYGIYSLSILTVMEGFMINELDLLLTFLFIAITTQ